jgi:hypothetical protein
LKLRDNFLQAIASKPLLQVEIADYGFTAYIGKLSAGERSGLIKSAFARDEAGELTVSPMDQMCLTVQIALRDADGKRAFTDTAEDLEIIRQMDGDVIAVLFEQALTFNRLGDTSVSETIKNSEAIQN